MKSLTALLFVLLALPSFASSQYDIDTPIDVDGSFEKRLTPAQKLKRLRKRLEKKNELLVKKQIETMRLQQELELNKKIQKAFKQTMDQLDQIN